MQPEMVTCSRCNGKGQIPLSDPTVNTPGKKHRYANEAERLAALRVTPKTGTLRSKVLEVLKDAPRHPSWSGLTGREIARLLEAREYSVKPRLTELKIGGWIESGGLSYRGETRWRLTAEAVRRLERQQDAA